MEDAEGRDVNRSIDALRSRLGCVATLPSVTPLVEASANEARWSACRWKRSLDPPSKWYYSDGFQSMRSIRKGTPIGIHGSSICFGIILCQVQFDQRNTRSKKKRTHVPFLDPTRGMDDYERTKRGLDRTCHAILPFAREEGGFIDEAWEFDVDPKATKGERKRDATRIERSPNPRRTTTPSERYRAKKIHSFLSIFLPSRKLAMSFFSFRSPFSSSFDARMHSKDAESRTGEVPDGNRRHRSNPRVAWNDVT